jgi:phenylpropionate dioxygenase-like ring-hydroxylating dioxygenase large terminal subunit
MFLRNAWYIAAVDEEVTAKPLSRKIMNEDIVLWRKPDGSVAAIEDRCCHRHLPLSMGSVAGDNIRCGYHGYLFNSAGVVIEIPGQVNIPEKARVKSYPVVERWKWIWVWMGNPAEGDPAQIPNAFWADHPEWKLSKNLPVRLKCNYHLICDNVLDVTHLTYVHPTSIGAMSLVEFEPVIREVEHGLRVERWIHDRPPSPAYKAAGGFPGNVDRFACIEYRAPNFCVNYSNNYDAGYGGWDRDPSGSPHKVEVIALSVPTPETETTCHYFFAFARNFGFDDPAVEDIMSRGMATVFAEDFPVLEAQQARMSAYPGANQVDSRNDAGVVRAHRILQRRIEEERARADGTAQ